MTSRHPAIVNCSYLNDERLTSAATGSTVYSMAYDALGRCVKRTLTGGPTTYYVYDGDKPIVEYDSSGASAGVNVYGKGVDEVLERVAIGADGQWHTYYLHQNHEGSVTLLTDTSGNVLERYRYDVFGAPTIYAPNWISRSATLYDNRFLFTGREPSEWGHGEMDGQAREGNGRAEREQTSQYAATYWSPYTTAAFNFYEYRARAYNAKLGRFMSEDPKLFDAGDYNLFRYCHNDPIDNVDPMGLEENLAQKPISAWDPTGRAWLKQLRDSVQEVLRQIARQQAYAEAYGRSGHGAIGIGMANSQVGQLQQALGGFAGIKSNVTLWADPKVHYEKTPTITKSDGMFGPVQVPALTRPTVDPDTISERAPDGTIQVSQRVAIHTRIGTSATPDQRALEMTNVRALVNWASGRGTADVRSALNRMQIHTSMEAERAVYNATIQSLRQFMAERAFQVDSPLGEHGQ